MRKCATAGTGKVIMSGTIMEKVKVGLCALKWTLIACAVCGGLVTGLPSNSCAYTTVILGPNVPESIEQDFLAATTVQFTVNFTTNPFFANTYQIILNGLNPAFNPPIPDQQMFNALNQQITALQTQISTMTQTFNYVLSTATFSYGFADGQNWEQWDVLDKFNNQLVPSNDWLVNCSRPTFWNSIQPSSTTFQLVTMDSTTCNAVLSAIYSDIYEELTSTPTVPTPAGPTESGTMP